MQGDEPNAAAEVVVPHTELSEDALRGVIESIVLREGTDYGEREVEFETKVGQILLQLQRGEAQIVFDPLTQTVGVMEARSRSVRP